VASPEAAAAVSKKEALSGANSKQKATKVRVVLANGEVLEMWRLFIAPLLKRFAVAPTFRSIQIQLSKSR
jgi:hypothetical protein